MAAVNEERFTRRKLEVCFPRRSIASCLSLAGVDRRDVTLVAASTDDIAKTLTRWIPATKERYYQIRRHKVTPGRASRLMRRAKYAMTEWPPNRLSRALSRRALVGELSACGIEAPLLVYDHHRCHAAAAAVASGKERSAVITIDGVGDGVSATANLYERGRLTRVATTPARHSLGVFFEHVTNLLDMRELEDEGKVMALADHAEPIDDGANPLLELVTVEGLQLMTAAGGNGLHGRLRRLRLSYPREQFALMAQRVVERRLVDLALAAVRHLGVRHVTLSGGVAANIKAARHLRLRDEVDDVYVFPHMGDGGLALGAAVCAALDRVGGMELPLDDLGLGTEFDDSAMRAALQRHGVEFCEGPDIAEATARLLAEEKVVLWFHGRMEYGPRALGHRSVLARPDRPALRDRINLLLKRREEYQPFCPSLLEDDAQRAFTDTKGSPNRHMTMAYMVAPRFRDALSGVTNIDGSCRPQMVREHAEGDFADLLRAARRHWGMGAVLNTSLNIHGEPLVHTPDEALSLFTRSGADAIVLGHCLAERGRVIDQNSR